MFFCELTQMTYLPELSEITFRISNLTWKILILKLLVCEQCLYSVRLRKTRKSYSINPIKNFEQNVPITSATEWRV